MDEPSWAQVVKPAFFGMLPPVMLAKRKIKQPLWLQGVGRHSREEIYRLARDDLSAIAAFFWAINRFFLALRPPPSTPRLLPTSPISSSRRSTHHLKNLPSPRGISRRIANACGSATTAMRRRPKGSREATLLRCPGWDHGRRGMHIEVLGTVPQPMTRTQVSRAKARPAPRRPSVRRESILHPSSGA